MKRPLFVLAIDSSAGEPPALRDYLAKVAKSGLVLSTQGFVFDFLVWCFDTQVYSVASYTEETIAEIKNYCGGGGGGTLFERNWDYMRDKGIVPDHLTIYTDGFTKTWGDASYCPTTFVITDPLGWTPTFGETIRI